MKGEMNGPAGDMAGGDNEFVGDLTSSRLECEAGVGSTSPRMSMKDQEDKIADSPVFPT
jgi:hypothetical protein